jgi:DNA polymerase-1
LPVDREAWLTLAGHARGEADRLREGLDAAGPPRPAPAELPKGRKPVPTTWNWNSPPQVKQAFALLGVELASTGDAVLAAVGHPLAEALRAHRRVAKRASAYGEKWLRHVRADGRVYSSWNPYGACVGRLISKGPNLQQLPRASTDPRYRRCVVAPEGRVLVKADWSTLHFRIAATVAPEPGLAEAFDRDEDVHALTARAVTGRQDVTEDDRQTAKIAGYGLMYGMSVKTFRAFALADYGKDWTQAEAGAVREGFFKAWPGLRAWHRRQRDGSETAAAPSGRAVYGVTRFSDKLSYRILLAEVDCLKNALALAWERRAEVPGAFLVLAAHDELVAECDAGQVDAVSAWLKKVMLDAAGPILAPVPAEVKVKVGRSWGGG